MAWPTHRQKGWPQPGGPWTACSVNPRQLG
jgi:hypothetical protein